MSSEYELGALRCIAAQPELLNGSHLRTYHFADTDNREAFKAAVSLHSQGVLFGSAEIARAIGKPAFAATITDGSVYGQEESLFDGYCRELSKAFDERTKNAFTIWAPSQFIQYTPDPSSILLGDGYIALGEWTSLIGIGGLGKTRLALWLCICQITGREWGGIKTHGEPQRCLILSTESGLRRLKTDLAKLLALLTEAERAVVENHLRLLALTTDEEGDLNLGDAHNVSRITSTLTRWQPGLVIFDPFSAMIDGDENKNSDIVASVRTLKRIQRSTVPNAAFVIIHHARTGAANVMQAGDNYNAGNFGRGGKALYAHVRCEIQLAPGDRDDPNMIVMSCGKANDCEKFKARGIVFDPESFAYAVDPAFDLDAWRSDVSGKRTGKSVTIKDVVESVRELCPHQDDKVTTKDLCTHVNQETAAAIRTIKVRLAEAVKERYLAQPRHGWYRLGPKPLKA